MESQKLLLLSRLLLIAGIVIPSLFALRAQVAACSCGFEETPAQAFERAHLVFRGTVNSVQFDLVTNFEEIGFSVAEVWKGPVDGAITLHTADSSDDCGYLFVVGGEYVVYMAEDGWVGLCGRTRYVEVAQEDFETLGEGREPAHDDDSSARYVPEVPPPPTDWTWRYVGIGFAVWGSLLSMIWLAQRSRT